MTQLEIENHQLLQARQCPSPNCDERTIGPESIDLVVIHGISLPPNEFGGSYIEDFFCNRLDYSQHPYFESIRNLKVCAHLLIRREGDALQFASFDKRAWHAGQSNFEGRSNCNDFSIGIELEGSDEIPYDERQYLSLGKILRCLIKQYPALTKDRIVGHSDIAPGRKTDPGTAFNWEKLKQLLS